MKLIEDDVTNVINTVGPRTQDRAWKQLEYRVKVQVGDELRDRIKFQVWDQIKRRVREQLL
jgi:hypothetical protein